MGRGEKHLVSTGTTEPRSTAARYVPYKLSLYRTLLLRDGVKAFGGHLEKKHLTGLSDYNTSVAPFCLVLYFPHLFKFELFPVL